MTGRHVALVVAILLGLGVLFMLGWLFNHKQKAPARAAAPASAPAPAPASKPRPAPGRPADADPDVILGPDVTETPGAHPVTRLGYAHPVARSVALAGSWSHWREKHPLTASGGRWLLDVRALQLPPGRHEFKFLPDSAWEAGANRVLQINADGLIERPPEIIASARIETPTRVAVCFKAPVAEPDRVRVRLEPDVAVVRLAWQPGSADRARCGYTVTGDELTFCFAPARFGLALTAADRVSVAGTFNAWNADDPTRQLAGPDAAGLWERTYSLAQLSHNQAEAGIQFKFVVNGARWVDVPPDTPTAATLNGHLNLRVDASLTEAPALDIHTAQPLALDRLHTLVIEGLTPKPLRQDLTPGAVLDTFRSDKPLGVTLDKRAGTTTYRLFAPRATRVEVCFLREPRLAAVPAETRPLARDTDGVWEVTLQGVHLNRLYVYKVDGPPGPGEGFDFNTPIGDPYARAAVHAHGPTLVVDPDAVTDWFSGWTDAAYQAPAPGDVLIYEAHVRDLTSHPSAGVLPAQRGTYAGLTTTDGAPVVLDHLKCLGVNMLELMPIAEFDNRENDHGWGYSSVYYFAPDASYSRAPAKGSGYYEFKKLVNDLHGHGIGVILDVVFNHVGNPNIFLAIDSKYYFRHNRDFTLSNFSGCGNDVRSEAPMVRRLIVDNVLYWLREHHVDGFRFDLCELIDMETLRLIEREARRVNPRVILISEPWSFRGDHKWQLRGTGWAAWNNDFRETVKRFVRGEAERQALQPVILGSVNIWAATPGQSVNYVESHDDLCLTDELTTNAGHDGRVLNEADAARHRLAATVLYTSFGLPLLAAGQEFMRSKRGLHNTYNQGDEVNALNWTERNRPLAADTLAYYTALGRLRASPAGATLRHVDTPEPGSVQWLLPSSPHALGYQLRPHGPDGAPFLVLLNGDTVPVTFDVRGPATTWRLVADGRRLVFDGMALTNVRKFTDAHFAVTVEPCGSRIFMGERDTD